MTQGEGTDAAKAPPAAAIQFSRQLPALEPETAFFWTAGAEGRLLICHCDACDYYIHPPLPRCPKCGSEAIAPKPVSGKARIASYTINVQQWLPGMPTPFVFAAVELAEQAELYVLTNIEGCALDKVRIGLPVEVHFEQQEDVFLPIFHPTEAAHVG